MKRARSLSHGTITPPVDSQQFKKFKKQYSTPIGVLATTVSANNAHSGVAAAPEEMVYDMNDLDAMIAEGGSIGEQRTSSQNSFKLYEYEYEYETSYKSSQDDTGGSQNMSSQTGIAGMAVSANAASTKTVTISSPTLKSPPPESKAIQSLHSHTKKQIQQETAKGDHQSFDHKATREERGTTDSSAKSKKLEQLISEERKRIKKIMYDGDNNKDLYMSFNDLQGIANEYKFKFDFPEIVVVGMQSDGKSSFVEALLGFQFNTIDTQIGTRRPLILQMITNEKYESPHCVFWKEDMSKLEDEATPVPLIEQEIRKRTDDICGKANVSSKPIILRVNYKYCANLTIYDTPGFRKGAKDPLGAKIMAMVMRLMEPQHRIIVCLEQSTVEWCNTQVRPIVQKVDPNFSRTIIVTTKFNNRNNQFKNGQEVNQYMSTDGHIVGTDVYFISLPSGPDARDLGAEEFKEKILDSYIEDFRSLMKLGFDDRFKQRLGFYNLKRHLEQLLHKKYKETVSPVLYRLEQMIEQRKKHLKKVKKEIKDMESESTEEIITQLINSYLANIVNCLNGTTQFNTLTNGSTLEEEKKSSECKDWPNYSLKLKIRNSQYKLYGGAQLERLLSEFEIVAHSQEFPHTTDDEVAVTIGLNALHTTPDYDRGASDLAQKKCKTIFTPLIDVLMQRSRYIMRNLFKIVISYMNEENQNSKKFATIFEEFQRVSDAFIDKVLSDVRSKTDDEFDTFTKIIDWDLISFSGNSQLTDYDLLNPNEDDTIKRVQMITAEQAEKFQFFGSDRSRELTEERCKKIKTVAARLFAGVRLLFVKYIRAKYNAFFLNPIFTEMDRHIRMHFNTLGTDKLKEMMGMQIVKLKKAQTILEDQVQKLESHRFKFKKMTELR